MLKNTKIISNSMGIVGCVFCLIHCLASPILMIIGMKFMLKPFVKYIFLIISYGAIYDTTQHSTDIRTATLLWVSFIFFLFSTLFIEEYEWLHIVNYIASFFIIIGHIINLLKCKKCNKTK